jgi:hypothetical protein
MGCSCDGQDPYPFGMRGPESAEHALFSQISQYKESQASEGYSQIFLQVTSVALQQLFKQWTRPAGRSQPTRVLKAVASTSSSSLSWHRKTVRACIKQEHL